MNKIVSLIQKLWQGKISPGEAKDLDKRMKENDAELKSFFYRPVEDTGTLNKNAAKILENLLHSINSNENKKARVVGLQRKTLWWAAAAIVLAVVGLQFFNFHTNNQKAYNQAIVSNIKKELVPLKTIINTTDSNLQIILADQSEVTVYPKSLISYDAAFDGAERNVILNGKALFKVAKDKQRPFTVYANGIATTALGTQFTVSTLVKNMVEIMLFEGKVKVRSANQNTSTVKEVYLQPGEMVKINKLNEQLAVTTFKHNSNVNQSSKLNKKIVANSFNLQFDNEPLLSVFEKLQVKYNTDIHYNNTELEGLYFSGSVLKTDSLKTILTIISNMNGLKYTEESGKIFITK